ncbi:MAG TPA: flagellar biosynthesis protein FlgD [Clostridium sp.]|nr:flagellar biosynthesis protein FlgD [Clostridium sp.]
MAIQTTLTNNYTNAADAKVAAKSSYESGKIGTTDRGTAIVEQNNGLGKNAFLNLLVAQLKNMDPTQDQDSTAYVSQMAQFSSIEQMNNLNTTMQDFAYEQMVGKVAILSDTDINGYNKYGIISQIIKNGTTTTATILDPKTGTYSNYSMNKIIGTSDSGYGSANYETALNSNFSAASTLARDNATAVYVEVTTKNQNEVNNGQNTTITTTTKTAHKCTIEKAYLDKQNSMVKVTIKLEDGTTKTVDYSTIAVAGKDLSDDVVNEAIKNNTTEALVTRNTTTLNNSSSNSNNTDQLINDENEFLAGLSI